MLLNRGTRRNETWKYSSFFARNSHFFPVLCGAFLVSIMCIAVLGQQIWPAANPFFTNLFFIVLWISVLLLAWICIRESAREVHFSVKQWLYALAGSSICILLAGIYLYFFLAQEATIKIYDFSVYWRKYIMCSNLFYNDIHGGIAQLIHTLGEEYSDLPTILMLPFSRYFGREFYQYVIWVYILYYVPFCILFALYILRMFRNNMDVKPRHYIMSVLICVFSAPLLHPVLLGYVDVIGLVLIMLHLHLVFNNNLQRFEIKTCMLLAVLSLSLLLARRWYAFWIVGFYFSFGFSFLIHSIKTRKIEWKKAGALFANLSMIAGSCLLWLAAVTPATLSMFLENSYSKAYSAYKTRTELEDIIYLCKDFGWLLAVIALIGIIIILFQKKLYETGVKWIVIFAVSFVLFQRVQSAGAHHRYLFIPIFLLGICCMSVLSDKRFSHSKPQGALISILTCVCLFDFIIAYVPDVQGIVSPKSAIFTQIREEPQKRSDIQSIRQIIQDMNAITTAHNTKAYLVGDSTVISQEVLKRSSLPISEDAMPNMINGSIIDLRDGFPSSAFLADEVLVGDPLQAQRGAGSEVIVRLYDLFEENPETKHYYALSHVYPLDGCVLRSYHRVRPITKTYIDLLKSDLMEAYPEDPVVYEPDYFLSLFQIKSSQPWHYFSWGPLLEILPYEDTVCQWQLDGAFDTLQLTVSNWNEGVTMVIYVEDNPVISLPLVACGDQDFTVALHGAERLTLTFDITDPTEEPRVVREIQLKGRLEETNM